MLNELVGTDSRRSTVFAQIVPCLLVAIAILTVAAQRLNPTQRREGCIGAPSHSCCLFTQVVLGAFIRHARRHDATTALLTAFAATAVTIWVIVAVFAQPIARPFASRMAADATDAPTHPVRRGGWRSLGYIARTGQDYQPIRDPDGTRACRQLLLRSQSRLPFDCGRRRRIASPNQILRTRGYDSHENTARGDRGYELSRNCSMMKATLSSDADLRPVAARAVPCSGHPRSTRDYLELTRRESRWALSQLRRVTFGHAAAERILFHSLVAAGRRGRSARQFSSVGSTHGCAAPRTDRFPPGGWHRKKPLRSGLVLAERVWRICSRQFRPRRSLPLPSRSSHMFSATRR